MEAEEVVEAAAELRLSLEEETVLPFCVYSLFSASSSSFDCTVKRKPSLYPWSRHPFFFRFFHPSAPKYDLLTLAAEEEAEGEVEQAEIRSFRIDQRHCNSTSLYAI